MNRKNDLHPFIFEQSVHTSVVIACFEELIEVTRVSFEIMGQVSKAGQCVVDRVL